VRRASTAGALAVILAVVTGCRAAPSLAGSVDRLDVTVEPTVDGHLVVRETYTLQPDRQGVMRFERTAETDEADGLELTSATAGGVSLVPGAEFDVDAGERRVRVRYAPTGPVSGSRQLTLAFKAVSAVAVTAPRATLSWPVLGPGRGFDVASVRAVLLLPTDSHIYPGTGIAEAGWVVDRTREGIVATRAPVSRDEAARLVAALDFVRSGVRDPVWERNRDRQRQFWPALVAGALFFIVIGIGVLVILRLQYPRRRQGVPLERESDERALVTRGLYVSGLVGAGMAVVGAGVSYLTLGFLGMWAQLIPASMLVVSLSFMAAAGRFRQ
jgi:hypothetical protein